jgi:4-amino-4-deoxy-L-arabinose transferase-like glycosyltransferase
LPSFIAVVQSLLGRDPLHLRIIFSLMGAFSCVLIFLVGEEAFNVRVAIFSSLVSVFFLPFWIINSMIMPGTLFLVLTLLILLFMFKTFHRLRPSYCILIGFCMGCAALMKPEFIVTIMLMLLFTYLLKRREAFTKCVLVMLVAAMILIVPWSAFASIKNETLVTISTNGGGTFIGCNNPQILEVEFWRKGFFLPQLRTGLVSEEDVEMLEQLTKGQRSNWLYRRSLRWLMENPGSIPELEAWKLFSFFFYPLKNISKFNSIYIKDPKRMVLMIVFAVQYFIILLMFLFGAMKTFDLRKHYPFLVYFIGGLTVVLVYGCDWRIISFLLPVYILYAGGLIFGPRKRYLIPKSLRARKKTPAEPVLQTENGGG